MPEAETSEDRTCRHCGAVAGARLGRCTVCGGSVCEHCGNVQRARGEAHVVHDSCLSRDAGGFSMIKFVK